MRSRSKVLLVTLAAVVVLPSSAIAIGHFRAERHLADAKRDAMSDVRAALPAATVLAEKQRAQVRDRYHLPAPSYSLQELSCLMETVGTVYTIESYRQQCYLRTVDVFPAADRSRRCRLIDLPGATDPSWLRTPVTVLTMRSGGVATGRWRTRCGQVDGNNEDTRLLSPPLPTEIAPDRLWTVIRIDTPISSTGLPCRPGSFLCGSPGGPFLPD